MTSPPNPLLTASLPSTHPIRLLTNATSPNPNPGTNFTLAPLTKRLISSLSIKTLRLGFDTKLILFNTGRSDRYFNSAHTRCSDILAVEKVEGFGGIEEEVEVVP